MDITNSEGLMKNLLIRNKYKDRVLKNRCQELRSAQKLLCQINRHCRNLEGMLTNKGRGRSDFADIRKNSKQGNCEYGKNQPKHRQCYRNSQEEKLDSQMFSDIWTSPDNLALDKRNDISVLPQFSDSVTNLCVSNSSNSLESMPAEQRKDIEMNLMAFENEELRLQLEHITSEKTNALDDGTVLRNELETVRREMTAVCKQLAERNNEVDMLTQRLFSAEEQQKDFSQMINDLKSEAMAKETASRESAEKIEELEELLLVLHSEKVEAGQKTTGNSNTQADRCENDVSLKSLIEEQENTINRLIFERDELDEHLASQKNLVAELQSTVNQLEKAQQNVSMNESWERERSELKEQIEILGAQVALLQSESSSSQQSDFMQSQQMSQLFSLKLESSMLQAEKDHLEERLNSSKMELESLQQGSGQLKTQLKHAEEESVKKDKEIQKLKQQFLIDKSQLLRSMKDLQVKCRDEQLLREKDNEKLLALESQNASLLAQLLVLEDKNGDLALQLSDVGQHLETTKAEVEEFKRSAGESTCCMKDLKSRNRQLQLQNVQIAEALGRAEEEFRRQRAVDVERISSLCCDMQEGCNERKHLEAEVLSGKVKLRSLESDLENSVTKSMRFAKEIDNLKNELTRAQNLNRVLECEVRTLTSDIERHRVPMATEASGPTQGGAMANRKRLKIGLSSEKRPLSTTQILQTPSSTQNSFHLSRAAEQEEDQDRAACLVVPESPLADRIPEVHKSNWIETPAKPASDDLADFQGPRSAKENQQRCSSLWNCQPVEQRPKPGTEGPKNTSLFSVSCSPENTGKTPNARRSLCLSRRTKPRQLAISPDA